uniref:Phosphatidylethanolamine binding protein 4 n=1 Tax=Salvator merianae TaxID=96440 RepID=A0A8D0KF96_SALMN
MIFSICYLRQDRMKSRATYFLAFALIAVESNALHEFHYCLHSRGGLEVLYPELGDVGCTYIPECSFYRKRISKEWSSPKVRYQQAEKNKKYVLIMVDPDAPSRTNPIYRFWRHWVITDIRVSSKTIFCDNLFHQSGLAYRRPTPPSQTGYHRYQFLLFEQPTREAISFSPEEGSSLGSWNVEDFANRFHLGTPVAATQFLTKPSAERALEKLHC